MSPKGAALDIDKLTQLYSGFTLDESVGNNAFSFQERQNQEIWIAPLVKAGLQGLEIGQEIVFSEIDEGEEINRTGLRSFLYMCGGSKDFFIFDNHNHAFFFWLAGLHEKRMRPGETLLHIDQHTDMRRPDLPPDPSWLQDPDWLDFFNYTNRTLNVGNFIQPALDLKLFNEVKFVDSADGFEERVRGEFVLDIDVDIFAPEMAYIDYDLKLSRIQELIERASFITIATSPFFIEQSEAIRIVKELLQPWSVS